MEINTVINTEIWNIQLFWSIIVWVSRRGCILFVVS